VERHLRSIALALAAVSLLLGAAALTLLGVVVALEGIVLGALRWGSYNRCMTDAALANAASTTVGLLVALGLGGAPERWLTPLGGLLALALSIAIEAAVLYVRRPDRRGSVLRTAVIMNVPTFVLLFLVALGVA